jgi:hypothetical protein
VRQKYPILFDEPVPLQAGRWYVAWARVSGPSSDCGSSGQSQVTTEDQIQFHFKSSKKSNNGTDVNAGIKGVVKIFEQFSNICINWRQYFMKKAVISWAPKFFLVKRDKKWAKITFCASYIYISVVIKKAIHKCQLNFNLS